MSNISGIGREIPLPTEKPSVGEAGASNSSFKVSAPERVPKVTLDGKTTEGANSARLTAEDAKAILESDPVAQATREFSSRMSSKGADSHIEFDRDSGRFVVKITDPVYGTVVLQIPSQDSLDLQKRLEEITGMILHKTG